MKKLAIASLVISLSSPVGQATNWIQTDAVSPVGTIVFVDTDTTRVKGNYIYAWMKYQRKDGSYDVARERFDCVNMKVKTLEGTVYSALELKHWPIKEQLAITPQPETAAELVWNQVCILWHLEKKTGKSLSKLK